MNYYNSETLLEQQQEIQKLKDERSALAAQVEALQKTVVSVKARGNILHNLTLQLMQAADLNGSDWDYISEAQVSEIQNHLRQVRAAAGRAGYLQGRLDAGGSASDWNKKHSEHHASQYHASILAGKE